MRTVSGTYSPHMSGVRPVLFKEGVFMNHNDSGADKLYEDIRQAIEDILVERRPPEREDIENSFREHDFEQEALRYLTD